MHDRGADDGDGAEALPHQRMGANQVDTERPFRPAVDEKTEEKQRCNDNRVQDAEDNQALDDRARDGQG